MWFELKSPGSIDSPSLVIYPERVKENIRTLVSMIDNIERLRPHVKTNKSPDASKLMIEAGIHKFKCATIAEAEMLATVGATDVLLAYQPVGPKLKRFAELAKIFPGTVFSCLFDNRQSAKEMSQYFFSRSMRVPVYLDLNVGMNRTGIVPGDEALTLYNEFIDADGIQPVGLHAYDGHIRNVDIELRKLDCDEAFALVLRLKHMIVEKGLPQPVIVAGGTPTFPIHCKRNDVECSPGTFIYWDKGYQDQCPEQKFLPAALVISRVISEPTRGKFCLDLGHKSIASENEIGKRVHFLNSPRLQFLGHSEEHLVVTLQEDHMLTPGKMLYGLPYHICPTVALYERALICENGDITGEWKTIARDRKISV